MKIALLAPSGSGKTCYVVSLFGVLSHKLQKDAATYPVKYEFTDFSQRSILQPQFHRLVRHRGPERFPDSTEGRTDYVISLSLHTESDHTLEVTLSDYPGGYLTHDFDNKEKIEETIDSLSYFDGFIVLLDANDIFIDNEYEGGEALASSQICDILEKARERKYSREFALHGMPVVFGVTKFDETEHTIEQGKSKITELFPNFFKHNTDCIPAIAAISLGENITSSGQFSPLNIDVPFDICVSLGILSKALHEQRQSSDASTKSSRSWSKSYKRSTMNPFEAFVDWIDNDFILASEYEAESREYDEIKKQHEQEKERAFSIASNIIDTLKKNHHIKIFKPTENGVKEVWFNSGTEIITSPLRER